MKLLDIQEPIEVKRDNKSRQIAIGIDFGTTNSLISSVVDGSAIIVGKNGSISSAVSIERGGIKVGKNHSKGDFTIKSIKRLLAKTYSDLISADFISSSIKANLVTEDNEVKIRVFDESFSLVYLASKIFVHLKQEAEEYFEQQITKAVITVPAHFDDVSRNKVKQAAEISGLEVLRMISEPTAAAYAYGLENASEGNYLVYDLGGGTFDVSILRMRMGVFQVLKTGGDAMLGGDDIDFAILSHIKNMLGLSSLDNEEEFDLLSKVQHAKEVLTLQNSCEILARDKKFILTQDLLSQIAKPFIDKTIKITKDTLELCESTQISGIILVGGSSRLQCARGALKQHFPNIDLLSNLDPDKIVAYGAARQAYNLTHQSEDLLIDITPLSLGLEVLGGFIERIIERHSPIPTKVTKYFTTSEDNQTGIIITILQGERELACECRKLATFELSGLPPTKAGLLQIAVTFEIDADGLLSVSAIDSKSERKCNVIVRPYYNLDEDKIDSMLYDAFKNSEEDHFLKIFNEAKMKIELLITNTNQILSNASNIITPNEITNIQNLMFLSADILAAKKIDDINNYLEKLEIEAEKISVKFLDYTIGKQLMGKNINEV